MLNSNLMKADVLKYQAAQYTKFVEWSEKDNCFIGSAPPIIGPCCHGSDEAKVYAELCRIVEDWIELLQTDECDLPEPLGKVSDFSGRFVLRLDPAMHRRLVGKALAAGESLNSYCVKQLTRCSTE